MQDIFLKQIQNIQKNYLIYIKDLPFLLERKKIEKIEKLVSSIEDKEKYIIHINALKQILNRGLNFKNVHRVIRFNQEAWLKPYIDMNTELRKNVKNEFEKDFFKLMNNSAWKKNGKYQKTQRY